jgi:hypothetical protein
MWEWLQCLGRPKISKLIEDDLYQAEREVLGLREQAHRLKVAHAKVEVALDLACEYRDVLKEQKNAIWANRGGLKQ